MLDRRDFPFFPLQETWSIDLGVAPSVGPTVGPGGVYLALENGNIGFFNLVNGRPNWSATLRATRPLVLDDTRLLVTTDGALDALRARDGEPLWRVPLPAAAAHAPVARSGWAVVALEDGRIVALRTDTGVSVWTIPLEGVATTAPVLEGDRLYVSTKGSALHARVIADGAAVWSVHSTARSPRSRPWKGTSSPPPPIAGSTPSTRARGRSAGAIASPAPPSAFSWTTIASSR